MKTILFIHCCLLFIINLTLSAQPSHAYEFNNSYADTYGGSPMIPNGGSLTSSGFLFEKGHGPNVSNVIDPNTYSIVMRFTQHYVGSWAKILDFKNRTVDGGVYITGGGFYFSNSDYSVSGFWPMGFMPDVPVIVCITRDGTTKEVRGYVDGTLGWTFEDMNDEATFTGPGNIIQVLIDNDPGLGMENTDGSLDYFKIYNYVVTDPAIINPSCGNSDSDCDGVANSCDVCPGGNDNGPCNATSLPPLSILPSGWLCSNNNNTDKILVCHQGSTICVSESSANTHLSHGDFLGPCSVCSQNYSVSDDEANPALQNNPGFELSPNPATDQVMALLTGLNSEKGQIVIHNQLGCQIMIRPFNPEESFMQFNLDESRFASGIYYVSLVTKGMVQTKRLIISH